MTLNPGKIIKLWQVSPFVKIFYFLFFFICPHKWEIRTRDFRFMRRDPQPIELPKWQLFLFFEQNVSHMTFIAIYIYNLVGPTFSFYGMLVIEMAELDESYQLRVEPFLNNHMNTVVPDGSDTWNWVGRVAQPAQ